MRIRSWIIGRWIIGRWINGRWIIGRWIIGRWIIGRWIIGLWIIGLWIIGPGPGPGPVGNGDFINFLKCSLLREGDQALFSGKSILRSELRIKGRTTTQLLKLVWSSYSKSGTGGMRWHKMALKWHIFIGRC